MTNFVTNAVSTLQRSDKACDKQSSQAAVVTFGPALIPHVGVSVAVSAILASATVHYHASSLTGLP